MATAERLMGWDTRHVDLHIRVSVHDESSANQDTLITRLDKRGRQRLQEMIEVMGPFPEGVEVEVD